MKGCLLLLVGALILVVFVVVVVDSREGAGGDVVPTPTPAYVPPPTAVSGYWHSHCARIRNDGGCDRRFRPVFHDRHFHRDSFPVHSEGNHW